MLNTYLTVKQAASAEITEKKSRFIASVAPVSSEEEAQAFLDSVRKKYKDAGHNVYAYKVGLENEIVRCSDDKEPSGTAGLPVLEVLSGQDIKNAIIVVTRYFGGTLLGTGGLARAYSAAAKEGIAEAGVMEKSLHQKISVTVSYSLSKKIQYEMQKNEYIIDNIAYEQDVTFNILVWHDKAAGVAEEMQNLSSGSAVTEHGEWVYV